MAGIFSYAAAGALQGFGQGLADTGKAKRDAMLRMIEQDRADSRADLRDQRAGERQDKQIIAQGERQDKTLKYQMDREDARASLFATTEKIQGADGRAHVFGITKTGTKVDLGEAPPESSGRMYQIADPNDPTRGIYVPGEQALGAPAPAPAKAGKTDDEIWRDALKQADSALSDDLAGGYATASPEEQSQMLKDRATSLYQQMKQRPDGAPKEAAATGDNIDMGGVPGKDVTGRGAKALEAPTAGKPKGAGTKEDPYAAATQAEIDWFKKNAAPGEVIVINGKTYAK